MTASGYCLKMLGTRAVQIQSSVGLRLSHITYKRTQGMHGSMVILPLLCLEDSQKWAEIWWATQLRRPLLAHHQQLAAYSTLSAELERQNVGNSTYMKLVKLGVAQKPSTELPASNLKTSQQALSRGSLHRSGPALTESHHRCHQHSC